MSISVLYDGWPIIYQPLSPAAQHLLTLLALLPHQVHPRVALPAEPPAWFPAVHTLIQNTPDSPRDRLNWEISILPNLAGKAQAEIIHHTHPSAAAFGEPFRVISPTGYININGIGMIHKSSGERSPGLRSARTFWSRVREALAQGGLSKGRAIFWPSDLPRDETSLPFLDLPPIVHPDFFHKQDHKVRSTPAELSSVEIPDTYVIYHGPVEAPWLRQPLSAWRWAADSIGDNYPLLVLGLDSRAHNNLNRLLEEYKLEGSVKSLPNIRPGLLPAIYRSSAALFHPAPVSPWGGAVRLALAAGVPVVANEQEQCSALVGPAAYLAPPKDARALGAALITVIVEEEIGKELSRTGLRRASTWDSGEFSQQLGSVYQGILSSK
jgi:glycosyltransferase involved in cell wall biosynthesis